MDLRHYKAFEVSMSYIAHSLGQNETRHYRAHFHPLYSFAAWGLLIAFLVFGALVYNSHTAWMTWLAVLIGFATFLTIKGPIWTTEIGVTNQRLIIKRGWLRRTTTELQLRAIEEVRLKQTLLGRFFNYGQIEIHGTGVDDLVLPAVADPVALQRAIQSARSDSTSRPGAATSARGINSTSNDYAGPGPARPT
jgi:uncharacterized membrane protein YdbT with pleckstrin-like domain